MIQQIFRGDGGSHEWELPEPPPWRRFAGEPLDTAPYDDDWAVSHPNEVERARAYRPGSREVEIVDLAILLRRPILITGRPGTGKSTLAYAIAHELGLGPVLRWPITSRTTLQDGLYRYDAIGRLQDANLPPEERPAAGIGQYIQLGPLGTALLPTRLPRVLLIDEIDKSDIDLPNDLLTILEEGEFPIPELQRVADRVASVPVGVDRSTRTAPVHGGTVRCSTFPIVLMTSNGERDFPPAFLRRCLQLDIPDPAPEQLAAIVEAHLGAEVLAAAQGLIDDFLKRRSTGEMATDQLLNAIFAVMSNGTADRDELAALVMRHLGTPG
ncbi:ATPase AAA [Actinoplanes lobatus]|uniref:ATPase AAA n=1 Tax=Actinoplanes lobatus TaxID=113568 RepID=A0A7W7HP40_9ACTN|nr:MoxR family ATPase [Actinoplanes lobatus]MBB4754071.1 MoxR-like ATPase [Actinoplanes lobatus]GGN76699.1 ATPase AAA [Actinoplanes lobatus]GIE40873.1 ATPase AAA [Actinoplanes lobatus]